MLFVTHIALAMHIGALTGYPLVAVMGALFPDIDHFFATKKHPFNLRKLLRASLKPSTDYPPRSFLHNIISLALVSIALKFLAPSLLAAFSLGYASHLLLDTLDHTDIYLFFPFQKNIRGPIRYNSFAEHVLACLLLVGFVVMYL